MSEEGTWREPVDGDDERSMLPWLIAGGVLIVVAILFLLTFARGSGNLFAAMGFFGLAAAVSVVALVLCIVVTVDAYKQGRSGWWVYLICCFVNPMQIVAVVAWYAHLRRNPWKLSEQFVL